MESLNAVRGALAALSVVCALDAQAQDGLRNVTTGGPLRPGVYGRIEVRGPTAPPVIYPQPVVASQPAPVPGAKPVYLYVPPGQVRRWKQNCGKWNACDDPVLFVRVDASPSQWGAWRHLREQVALQGRQDD